MYAYSPERLRRATALALIFLLAALPVTAGIRVQGTQGLTMTGADGIHFDNTQGLTMTGADGFLAFSANGITGTNSDGLTMTGADGLTMTGADGLTMTGADGVTYTGTNVYTARRVDGLTMTGADGLTMTGADGLTMTGADGTTYKVNSVVVRQPNGLTMTGVDGLTMTGADGLTMTGADGLTMTGADGLTMTGVDSVRINSANQVIATSTDGTIFSAPTNGLTMTGADGLTMTGADGLTMTGVDGLTMTGADGLTMTGADAAGATGLMSLDPELALMLDQLTDDSTVNAVVVYHRAVTDADIAELQRIGVSGGTRYRALPMVALTATKDQIDVIADLPSVRTVYGNRTLQWNADESRAQTGLLRMRQDSDLRSKGGAGPEGSGVAVAVLDTGLDATHSDLSGRVVRNVKLADLQGLNPVGFTAPVNVENLPSTDQASGHGTFVGGIIAGSGSRSGGKFRGFAPKARLVGLSAGDASLLSVLAGFDYLLSNPNLGVRVINCSFSANTVYDSNDPVNVATRLLVERGVNVVFSAGNTGPGLNSLNPYAAAPWVISVGAVDGKGRLAGFSSRGEFGSQTVRPTLVAPGVGVVSLRAAGTNLTGTTGAATGGDTSQLSATELPYYTTSSGTSFSAPQVAGTIALMLEANPRLTPAEVRDILQRTATPLPAYFQHEAGAGMLNTHAAVLEAAFPQRDLGLFRAVSSRGQVRFVKDPARVFSGTVIPGTPFETGLTVPADAVYASTQVAWGPLLSTNDLALAAYDPAGQKRAESNYINLPGLTGKRERTLVNTPAAGTWRVRVTHTLSAIATPQEFKGVFETARVEYAPLKDLGGLDGATLDSVRLAIRSLTMWPDGSHFRPNAAASRYDLAAALVAAGRVPQYMPASPSYQDVTDKLTMNFVESVQAAPGGALFPDAPRGGVFQPDKRVTRLLAAVVLVRAAGLQAEAESNTLAATSFTDVLSIPSELRGYVEVAAKRGLLSKGSQFNPDGAFTRADLARALAAMMKN